MLEDLWQACYLINNLSEEIHKIINMEIAIEIF